MQCLNAAGRVQPVDPHIMCLMAIKCNLCLHVINSNQCQLKNVLNYVVTITFVRGVCAAPKMVIMQMDAKRVKRKINDAKSAMYQRIMSYYVYQKRRKRRKAGTEIPKRRVNLLPKQTRLVVKIIPHNHIVCKSHLKVPGQTS